MKNYLTEVLVILADAGVEFVVGGGVALRSAENWNGCKKLKRCRCVSAPIANGDRIAGEVAAPKAIQKLSQRLLSRNDREGEIVSVAAFVAGLEVVAVDRDDAAIG